MLAAGKGTRMRSQVPKVLHRICGREMVGLVVDAVKGAGIDTTAVVVAPDSGGAQEALGDGVKFAVQAEPLGTGHALLQARELLEGVDDVMVLSGDVPLVRPETLRDMMRLHVDKEASMTLLTSTVPHPEDLGRVVRGPSGGVVEIIEYSEADERARAITEVNAGAYCFRTAWLWPNLERLPPSPNGETYVTDLVSAASQQGEVVESVEANQEETVGVNTRVQLAEAEATLRKRVLERWMLSGVTMPDPASVYIDLGVELGQDTVVHPNTHVRGRSRIGRECEIGPNAIVEGSEIGDRCRVVASVVEDSVLEDEVAIGPFSHIRPGSRLGTGVHIGNFGEVNRSRLGRGTRSPHFSYIGDADIGADVNIGAGTVTCNYDGAKKNHTRIEDGALIGSDTMLVAPVTIGARSRTGAGAVVTRDVPPETLVVGVPARPRPKKGGGNRG